MHEGEKGTRVHKTSRTQTLFSVGQVKLGNERGPSNNVGRVSFQGRTFTFVRVEVVPRRGKRGWLERKGSKGLCIPNYTLH